MPPSSAAFESQPSALADVRAFVRSACPGLDDRDLLTLLIVVNELASNAIVHTAGGFRVELRTLPGAVRVEVHDPGTRLPELRRAGPDDPGGRGLQIVQALSSAWGSIPERGGKLVWAEIPSPSKDPER
jgi:anti-sigma regulatory factor (Ser/Thr protein kinase)